MSNNNRLADDQIGPALEAAGYRYVSGYGPSAVWAVTDATKDDKTPVGTTFAQASLANSLYGAASPYSAGALNSTQTAPDRSGQVAQGPDGQWHYLTYDTNGKEILSTAVAPPPASANALTFEQQMQLRQTPSSSYNVSQSIADPQSIALQQAQLQATIAANEKTAQHLAAQDALAVQQQNWLVQKDMLAAAQGDKQLQQTTQYQMATIQNQRDQLQFQIQNAQQQAYQAQQQMALNIAQFNAQGANDAAKFNAQQSLAVQQANNQAEQQRTTALQNVNAQIGQLGQDTGNRGLFASFLAANPNYKQQNTAIGQGTSLIDQSSVQPLEQSLQNKQQIEAQPANPYTFTPIQFNPISAMNMTAGPLTQQVAPQQPAQQTTAGGASNAFYQRQLAAANASQGGTPVAGPGASATTDASGRSPQQINQDNAATRAIAAALGLPAAEQGGMIKGAFMAGDSSDGKENAEIVIPLGDAGGSSIVVSTKGMSPEAVKGLKKSVQRFQTGGLFSNLDDAPLSQQFLGTASQNFRAGTPWANQPGALPSPVYGSSPGFSPLLNQFLSSGRALEQGLPASYSDWLTQQFAPAAISDRTPIFRGPVTRSG